MYVCIYNYSIDSSHYCLCVSSYCRRSTNVVCAVTISYLFFYAVFMLSLCSIYDKFLENYC